MVDRDSMGPSLQLVVVVPSGRGPAYSGPVH